MTVQEIIVALLGLDPTLEVTVSDGQRNETDIEEVAVVRTNWNLGVYPYILISGVLEVPS